MSDIPEREVAKVTDFLKAFWPVIITALFGIFMKSFRERSKIDSLRKSFLATIRFKMALDVANSLPEKNEDIRHDDYVEICANELNEYFSANSDLIVDFMNSEKVYKSYVVSFKFFKYGIVIIPLIAMVCGLILLVSRRDVLTFTTCCFSAILLILIIFILWILKERKNDRYVDLCSKYEVVE